MSTSIFSKHFSSSLKSPFISEQQNWNRLSLSDGSSSQSQDELLLISSSIQLYFIPIHSSELQKTSTIKSKLSQNLVRTSYSSSTDVSSFGSSPCVHSTSLQSLNLHISTFIQSICLQKPSSQLTSWSSSSIVQSSHIQPISSCLSISASSFFAKYLSFQYKSSTLQLGISYFTCSNKLISKSNSSKFTKLVHYSFSHSSSISDSQSCSSSIRTKVTSVFSKTYYSQKPSNQPSSLLFSSSAAQYLLSSTSVYSKFEDINQSSSSHSLSCNSYSTDRSSAIRSIQISLNSSLFQYKQSTLRLAISNFTCSNEFSSIIESSISISDCYLSSYLLNFSDSTACSSSIKHKTSAFIQTYLSQEPSTFSSLVFSSIISTSLSDSFLRFLRTSLTNHSSYMRYFSKSLLKILPSNLSSQLSSSLCSQQSWSSSSLSMQNSIQMHLQSSFFQYKATSFIHTISSFTCSNVSILISHYSKYSRFCQRSVSISIQFASYSSFYSSNISNSEASMLYLKNTNFSSKKCSSFFKKLSINPHSSFFSSAPFHSFLYDKSRWVNMDF